MASEIEQPAFVQEIVDAMRAAGATTVTVDGEYCIEAEWVAGGEWKADASVWLTMGGELVVALADCISECGKRDCAMCLQNMGATERFYGGDSGRLPDGGWREAIEYAREGSLKPGYSSTLVSKQKKAAT